MWATVRAGGAEQEQSEPASWLKQKIRVLTEESWLEGSQVFSCGDSGLYEAKCIGSISQMRPLGQVPNLRSQGW